MNQLPLVITITKIKCSCKMHKQMQLQKKLMEQSLHAYFIVFQIKEHNFK